MNWLILIIAGLFETGFAICLGKANNAAGKEKWGWLLGFTICLCVSMILLAKASKSLPIGTAYAVWTGIGAAGTAILGMLLFKEPADFWRLFFIFTLIVSIIGLKWASH